jgi:hypothetical protein
MLSGHSLSGGLRKREEREEGVQPQEDGEEREQWSSRTRSESSRGRRMDAKPRVNEAERMLN